MSTFLQIYKKNKMDLIIFLILCNSVYILFDFIKLNLLMVKDNYIIYSKLFSFWVILNKKK